jgi:hypothetical protein
MMDMPLQVPPEFERCRVAVHVLALRQLLDRRHYPQVGCDHPAACLPR